MSSGASYKLIELEEHIERLSRRIEQLREAIQVPVAPGEVVPLGRVRLSVNFLELFTTLIHQGLMEPKSVGYLFPIAPSATYTIDITVPKNKISISAEWRLFVDTDHALSMNVYIDDKLVMHDADVVQANYSHPVNFFRIGAIIPVQRSVKVVLTNGTADMVNVNLWETYGELDRKVFTGVLKKYFDTLMEEVGL